MNGTGQWASAAFISAGNWIDGEARFNMSGSDARHDAAGQQVRSLSTDPGMTTKVLSGDDHEGWHVQREGVNIGQLLEFAARKAGREDITDIG